MYDYRQQNCAGKLAGDVKLDLADEVQAWKSRSEELATWVVERMAVRWDAYGKYYVSGSGEYRRCKEDGMVDQSRIISHFAGNDFGKIIGLFSTSVDDTCLWLAIDFDRHEGDPEEVAEAVSKLSLHVYRELERLGFHPLLIDSNGRGGRHLLVLFDRTVPAREARAFGLWLVRAAGTEVPGHPLVGRWSLGM